MKLLSIAGARPNFMKLASIAAAVEEFNRSAGASRGIEHLIVHTGQHYDRKMSTGFFEELGIPRPDVNLEVGSGSHAAQTAEIMRRFEPVLLEQRPDVLLVVGDVNSTIACTLVAAKIEYPQGHSRRRPLIVHVEAGLRSFDRDMPEEINRMLTDALSDILFVTEQSGVENLGREGISSEKIHLVGNVMIDTLQKHLDRARQRDIGTRLGVPARFGLVTLHRPSNVDAAENLWPLVKALVDISKEIPLFFPVHPRTMKQIELFGLRSFFNWNRYGDPAVAAIGQDVEDRGPAADSGIYTVPPLGYLDFLSLTSRAALVITDSGGIQEETTFLGVPCVTMRENTERPVTVEIGSNYLVGVEPGAIVATAKMILNGDGKKPGLPPWWDGLAGERIVRTIAREAGGLAA